MSDFNRFNRQIRDMEVSHLNDMDFTRYYSKIPYISTYDFNKIKKEDYQNFYAMLMQSEERIISDDFLKKTNMYDRMMEYMNYIYLFTYLHRALTDGLRGRFITELLESEPFWVETKARIDTRLTRNQRFGLEYEISLLEDIADVIGFVRSDVITEDIFQLLLLTEDDIYKAYTTQSTNPHEIINFLNIHYLLKTIISMSKYISSGKNNSLFVIYFKYFMNSFNTYRFFDYARVRAKRYVREKYKSPLEIELRDPLTVLPEELSIKDLEKEFITNSSSENVYMMDISGYSVTKEGQKYVFMDELKRVANLLYGLLEPYYYELRDPYVNDVDVKDEEVNKSNVVFMPGIFNKEKSE